MSQEHNLSNNDLVNAIFAKLSESLLQQNALSINAVNVPEFKGMPNQDIHEFLAKFNLATLCFSKSHKCLELNRALEKSALIWAQSSIRCKLEKGEWPQIEQLSIERFGPPDRKLYYREKLSQMRYEPTKSTLISYAEEYIALYTNAYPGHEMNEIIHALLCNLPDTIIKGLNLLNDDWVNFGTLKELYSLINRYERNIMAFEAKEKAQSQTVSADAIKTMIEEIRVKFLEDINKNREQNKENSKVSYYYASNAIKAS